MAKVLGVLAMVGKALGMVRPILQPPWAWLHPQLPMGQASPRLWKARVPGVPVMQHRAILLGVLVMEHMAEDLGGKGMVLMAKVHGDKAMAELTEKVPGGNAMAELMAKAHGGKAMELMAKVLGAKNILRPLQATQLTVQVLGARMHMARAFLQLPWARHHPRL